MCLQPSLSLPASPYIPRRKGSRGSTQFSWKKGKHMHCNDRQPLVHHNPEALPLPFADDSAAVTPSSEDLCNSPFLPKNVPNGRRFSFANLSMYRHPLAAGRSGSRRSSAASQHSRSSRASRNSIRSHFGEGRSKMETLLMFKSKTNKSKAPDVVLDTSKLDDTVSGSLVGCAFFLKYSLLFAGRCSCSREIAASPRHRTWCWTRHLQAR